MTLRKKQGGEGGGGEGGGRTHRPYPEAFGADAIALVRRSGLSMAHVARDLGITPETLRLWIRQTAVDAGRQEGLTTEEGAELARLRRENRILKEEREILKKAAAFFATESTTR